MDTSQAATVESRTPNLKLQGFLVRPTHELDPRLPEWARRSYPIVRRELGIYWKVFPLEAGPLLRLFLIQIGLMLLSFFIPFVFTVAMPMIGTSLILMPFMVGSYGRILFNIGVTGIDAIIPEQRNNALTLLRLTPLPFKHVLAGKVAAAVWREIENLGLILLVGVLLTLPLLILQYASLWPPDQYPYVTRMMIMLGLGTALLRLLLEPMMIGAIAIAVGASLPQRLPAIAVTTILSGFYFLLINLPRLLSLSWEMRLLVEMILPLALPLLLTWGALTYACSYLERD